MKIEEVIKSSITLKEETKAVLNVMYTEHIISDKFNELMKPYEISGEQYNVLRILRGRKGSPANMSYIQERMITKNSNTTRLIDKLLLKELVTRKVCPENRRKIEVYITAKGIDTLEKLDDKVTEFGIKFGSNLSSEELIQMNILLEKYRNFK